MFDIIGKKENMQKMYVEEKMKKKERKLQVIKETGKVGGTFN